MTRQVLNQHIRMYENMTFSFTPLHLEDYRVKREYTLHHCGRAIRSYWSAVGMDIANAVNKTLHCRHAKS